MNEETSRVADRWTEVTAALERRLGLARTFRWLPSIGVEAEDGESLTLRAQTPRAASLARKYFKALKQALSELGFTGAITIVSGATEAIKTAPAPDEDRSRPAAYARRRPSPAEPARELGLEHRLDRFHPAPNELALRFAGEVAARPGTFSPLFIWGRSGLGKTHLLQGIVLRFRQQFPDRRARYLSAEALGRQFSAAAHQGDMAAFHRATRDLDLMALDDLQALATKTATRANLLHLLDALDARGAQVVAAAAAPPQALAGLEEALRSRLMSGVCVELKSPDADQARALLQRINRRLTAPLDEAVLAHVAERFPAQVREAIQAAVKLDAYRQLTGKLMDRSTARRVLDEMIGAEEEMAGPETIARRVGEAFQVSSEAILRGGRKANVARARQIAMALTRRLTDLTLAEIGAAFGGRSSGAVHFALRRVRQYCEEDAQLKATTEDLAARFGPSA